MLANGPIFRPLSGGYQIPRGQVLVQYISSDTPYTIVSPLTNFGDCVVDLDIKGTDTDIRTSEDPYRRIVESVTAQEDGELKLTVKQFSQSQSPLAFMATPNQFVAQASVTGTTTVTGCLPGQIIELKDANGNRVYNAVVTGVQAAGVALTTDVAGSPVLGGYFSLGAGGLVEIRKNAFAVATDVTVTWTAPVIATSDQKQIMAIMSKADFRAKLLIVQNNLIGKSRLITLPKVKLTMTQSPKLISDSNDTAMAEFSGKILLDNTQAPGFESGYVVDLN